MKTEIITIGDEILLGHIVDSNSAFIADRLSAVGVEVSRLTTLGDGEAQIVEGIREALGRADLIITTGGLGPTEDDLTKQALCRIFERRLVFHPEVLDLIRARYSRRGIELLDSVKTQADLPEGAILFPNPLGSALGILLEKNGQRVLALPGVPTEMKAIMESSVIPWLRELKQGLQVLFRNIQTFGTFESFLSEKFKQSDFRHAGCELAYLPSLKGVVLRLTYRGQDRELGEQLLKKYSGELQLLLEDYYVSDDGRGLLEVTADLLRAGGKTVATVESCTGGLIAAALTDLPGSSDYFRQGLVTYSNQSKLDRLAISEQVLREYGAVSEEVVHLMAEKMRQMAGTDYVLAVSGIAGPTGGTPEKPVGLIYIGLASDSGIEVHRHIFGSDRRTNRERTLYNALNYLRLKMLND